MSGPCICDTGKFCRPCHCRRIAAAREARPGYKEQHAKDMQARWDRQLGSTLLPEERPMLTWMRSKGFRAPQARLVVLRSRAALRDSKGED
jgi:hypothetical protein